MNIPILNLIMLVYLNLFIINYQCDKLPLPLSIYI
jgi:hypothetical protein